MPKPQLNKPLTIIICPCFIIRKKVSYSINIEKNKLSYSLALFLSSKRYFQGLRCG